MKRKLIYEIKSGEEIRKNFKALWNRKEGRFYWNQAKFTNDEPGSEVFVINRHDRKGLFCRIEEMNISSEYKAEEDITWVYHQYNTYEVQGEWDEFLCMTVLEEVDVPESWNWTRQLGQAETYILWEGPKTNSPEKRLEKVEDLQKLFKEGTKGRSALENTANNLKETLGTMPEEKEPKKDQNNLYKSFISHIATYMQSKGFYFKEAEVANFYLSLRAKPFVILAGISGTGKTKLATLFIEALGYKDNCWLIPVRPDWTDNSDLVGYTDLQGQFQAKALLKAAKAAVEHPEEPFFFILDEMNLARVEYYFSDFLSHIESRERDEAGRIWTQPLLGPDATEGIASTRPYADLRLPDNLYVIGTVNMDETTHPFSRKVLDRANSIEMNEVDLGWKDAGAKVKATLEEVYNDFLKAPYLNSRDITKEDQSELGDFIEKLQRINQCLEPADLHFAYRVRDEMAFYLLLNKKYKLLSEGEAFDFQLMQKVLPRIQGSSAAVKNALLSLLKELESIVLSPDEFNQSNLEAKVKQVSNPKYPRSLRKIVFMLKRYDNDGFTSFWQ